MQPPRSEICVICGVAPAETMDHVPPKGLFRGVSNAQLRTVPACRGCNNGASSDDEDVRFFISAQIGKQNSASKSLWEEGAHKTILRKTRLREAFIASGREVPICGPGGSVSTRIQFVIPERTYHRVFERATRGLYFLHANRILPASVPVSVAMLEGIPNMEVEEIQALHVEDVGNGACIYRYGIAPENIDCSTWIYQFHYAHWTLATTGELSENAF
jgi:hypothetical protein